MEASRWVCDDQVGWGVGGGRASIQVGGKINAAVSGQFFFYDALLI